MCATPSTPSIGRRVTFWCHMAAPSATVVVPGEPLSGMLRPGEGSFVWSDGKVRASVIGSISLQGVQPAKKKRQMTAALPTVGDLVTCRVARINPRQATLDIICVGDLPLSEPCSGLIRREDVRQGGAGAANEPVEIYRSFRPGDIVLARVLSLGDARSYYLSCVGAELGVVLCRSATDGAVMRAVSHAEVECPVSGVRERRKVARPADLPAALARGNGGGGAG